MVGKIMKKMVFLLIPIAIVVVLIYIDQAVEIERGKADLGVIQGLETYLEDEELSALVIDGDDLYVGGESGVYRFDTKKRKVVETITEDLSLVYSSEMIITDDGSLWIGHDEGLSIYKKSGVEKQWVHFQYPDIPKGRCNTIESIGSKVYAGFQEGVIVLSYKDKWEVDEIITTKEGLIEPRVQEIKDSKIGVWFGSYYCDQIGGVSILSSDKENKWQYLSMEEGLPHKYVTSMEAIYYNNENYMLIGTGHLEAGGLAIVKIGKDHLEVIKTYDTSSGLPGNKVRFVGIFKGDVVITTEANGIMITSLEDLFDDNELSGTVYDRRHGLTSNEIKVVVEAPDGLWLGGKYGINKLVTY